MMLGRLYFSVSSNHDLNPIQIVPIIGKFHCNNAGIY